MCFILWCFLGKLSPIKAGNAYTKEELQDLLRFAKANELEVIPLIQTFGHVEFALKTEPFANLREVPGSPQALCPSNNSSMEFIEELIRQVGFGLIFFLIAIIRDYFFSGYGINSGRQVLAYWLR